MERLKVLLIVLMAASLGLAVSVFILALDREPGASPIDVLFLVLVEGSSLDIPFYVVLSPLLFLTTVLASVIGVIYFLVLPEFKSIASQSTQSSTSRNDSAVEMIMRTLKPEERKVVEVLLVHKGTYLQKYISKEANLSKVKAHRVVARLSDRGLVLVVKRGNTNEVSLVDWFLDATQGRS